MDSEAFLGWNRLYEEYHWIGGLIWVAKWINRFWEGLRCLDLGEWLLWLESEVFLGIWGALGREVDSYWLFFLEKKFLKAFCMIDKYYKCGEAVFIVWQIFEGIQCRILSGFIKGLINFKIIYMLLPKIQCWFLLKQFLNTASEHWWIWILTSCTQTPQSWNCSRLLNELPSPHIPYKSSNAPSSISIHTPVHSAFGSLSCQEGKSESST